LIKADLEVIEMSKPLLETIELGWLSKALLRTREDEQNAP